MRDSDTTKNNLIAELIALKAEEKTPVGFLADGHGNPAIYKQVLDDLPQMVFEIDADGYVTYANRETIRKFGFSEEDVVDGITLKMVFHPDDLDRAFKNFQRVLTGEDLTNQEYTVCRKDGSSFPAKIYSKQITQSGKAIGIRGTIVDISDSKQTEDALRKSKNYYQTLFNNTGTAMSIFGADMIIRSCNDQFVALCESTKKQIEGKKKWIDFTAPEDVERILAYHEERSKEGNTAPLDYDFTFITERGNRRFVHIFIQIIAETKDRVCSLIDITNRKATEEALRRSEQRYELVVRGANDGIWDWNLETDSVYFSPRYKAILGYQDHEFPNVADSWKSHVHPSDLDHVIAANIECIEGRVPQFEVEYRMRHKEGSWRWILGRGAHARDKHGKIYRLAGTHTDITERKIQEQTTNAMYAISKAVSTSEDLQELFESIHSILNEVIDATNFFICMYDKATDSVSFPYWEDEKDTYAVIKHISSPDTPGPTAEILRTGQGLFLTKKTPEAIRRWEELGSLGTPAAAWIGVPLRVRDNIIGTMTVQHYGDPYRYSENDITLMEATSEQVAMAIERKQSEKALTRLNEQLESKVEARTAELMRRSEELEAANKRLTELDEIKSTMVSSISHELRTPLTSIRGFAKLAGKDFHRLFRPLSNSPELEKKGARIESNLQIIESEGERLTRLINDFLDINRIESGMASWNDVTLNPSDIVGMAASALSGVFAGKPEVELITDIPASASSIHADPDKIQQVLINLLGNAAKFTHKGSVTVSLKDNIDTVIISVKDTGEGVHKDELDKIFEKFHKSRKGDTITTADKGTGLGLAICKEIVTHYGGSIWVESTYGQGSTFSFSLNTIRR